jgi:hypothetical protein
MTGGAILVVLMAASVIIAPYTAQRDCALRRSRPRVRFLAINPL